MTNGSDKLVHAANARGIKRCGDTASGDQRQNVDKYPEEWKMVTCLDCVMTRITTVK